ncbi:MAG: putative lipid II flippase FtsW [Oscillospiraceae bacterium]|nr:cell division protein FtsW [Ruminococcus sp.]MDE6707116.1 putative lipid II flippase FtsW [Oscillospiraceae bacterium]
MTFAIVVLILLGLGIVMMFSASYAIAINEGKDGSYYALRQAIFGGVGLVAMVIISFIDYHVYQKFWVAIGAYITSVVLLILVLLIGTDLGSGCKRWIRIPGGQTFQPSEIAKFAVIILFAYLIDMHHDKMKKLTVGTLPFMLLLAIIAGLLLKQPHLSATILICLIGVALIYVGGAKWWHLGIFGLLGVLAIAGVIAYKVISGEQGYFATRLETWRDPFADDRGFQTQQSLIAIGSGGLFGLGLGESRQKFLYLPESENDFVFSIVCEELGLVGAITVILLFVLLIAQGFHIATHCKDRFGMLIAVGFTLQIGLQAFINIAVVSNVMPNTGISLPFFSYGGTALMMQLAQMGIVLNVSRGRYVVGEEKQKRKSTVSTRSIRKSTA